MDKAARIPAAERKQNKRDSCESLYLESGSDLSSRAVSSQVLSALKGLTSVFGMGTGVTPSSLPPEIVNLFCRFPLPVSPRHFPLHVVPGFRACGRGQRAFRSPSALLRVAPISGFPSRMLRVSFVMRLFPHPDNCTGCDSVSYSADLFCCFLFSFQRPFLWSQSHALNQALDRLVSSSSTHYCASTDDLSTW